MTFVTLPLLGLDSRDDLLLVYVAMTDSSGIVDIHTTGVASSPAMLDHNISN